MNTEASGKSIEVKEQIDFTFKDFAFTIVLYFLLLVLLSLCIGIYLGIQGGLNDKNKINAFLLGPYGLVIDAFIFFKIIILYKPARSLLKPLWDFSALKKANTYVYIILGFIIIVGAQYLILNVLNLETVNNQVQQLGPTSFNNLLEQMIFILSVALITPIKEELLYRGLICNYLSKCHHVMIGIIVSSLLFGSLHIGFPLTASIMGTVFAVLFYKTKSIIPSLILHMLWNIIASFSLLF